MNAWDYLTFFLVLLGTSVAVLVPVGRIVKRMGFSLWWLLLFFAPFGPLIGLWLVAFSSWPMQGKQH
jgi:hypothetical protein